MRHFDAAGKIDQRILSERHCDFASLPFRKIFFTHDAALFSRRNIKAQRVAIVNHDAISAEVYPARVGIGGDIHRSGSDIAAAVEFVPLRGGELPHIDLVALENIFQNRTVVDVLRRNVIEVVETLAHIPHDVEAVSFDVHMHRDGQPLGRIQRIREDAVALRITLDIVKKQRMAALAAMVAHLGNRADFDVPVGSIDVLQLADAVDRGHPIAQVARLGFALCTRAHLFRKCRHGILLWGFAYSRGFARNFCCCSNGILL